MWKWKLFFDCEPLDIRSKCQWLFWKSSPLPGCFKSDEGAKLWRYSEGWACSCLGSPRTLEENMGNTRSHYSMTCYICMNTGLDCWILWLLIKRKEEKDQVPKKSCPFSITPWFDVCALWWCAPLSGLRWTYDTGRAERHERHEIPPAVALSPVSSVPYSGVHPTVPIIMIIRTGPRVSMALLASLIAVSADSWIRGGWRPRGLSLWV